MKTSEYFNTNNPRNEPSAAARDASNAARSAARDAEWANWAASWAENAAANDAETKEICDIIRAIVDCPELS